MNTTTKLKLVFVLLFSFYYSFSLFAAEKRIEIDIPIEKAEDIVKNVGQKCRVKQVEGYLKQILGGEVEFSLIKKYPVDIYLEELRAFQKCGKGLKSLIFCRNQKAPDLEKIVKENKSLARVIGTKYNDHGVYRYGIIFYYSNYSSDYSFNKIVIEYQEIDEQYLGLLNEVSRIEGQESLEFYEINNELYKAMKNQSENGKDKNYLKEFVGGVDFEKVVYEKITSKDELGGDIETIKSAKAMFLSRPIYRLVTVDYTTGFKGYEETTRRSVPTILSTDEQEFERCVLEGLN